MSSSRPPPTTRGCWWCLASRCTGPRTAPPPLQFTDASGIQRNSEDRASTTSQQPHGEYAPIHAAWKVPVPWGSKCQRETARFWPKRERRCHGQICSARPVLFASAQPSREHPQGRQLNGAYSATVLSHPGLQMPDASTERKGTRTIARVRSERSQDPQARRSCIRRGLRTRLSPDPSEDLESSSARD